MSYLKDKYTLQYIRENNLILAEVVLGSHAFGLNTPKSDIDLAGIFFMERNDFYSLHYRADKQWKAVVEKDNITDQDVTFMEIGKFMELVANGNPNALEILAACKASSKGGFMTHLRYRDDLVDFGEIPMSKVLTKKCEKSFGEYAAAQIKKARGLNKKIFNPVAPERKTPIDFCYVMEQGKTKALRGWLERRELDQKFCGVVALSNARDSYGLYYDNVSSLLFGEPQDEDSRLTPEEIEQFKEGRKANGLPLGYGFKGIELENSNEIRLSSIPKMDDARIEKDIEYLCSISYNKDGYIKHCKDYREYWEWVNNRNEDRYNNNLKQNYDTKNISHCIRLLTVAKEIAEGKGIILKRTDDRQFLLDVKLGKVEYDIAMEYAEKISNSLEELYKKSTLPADSDIDYLNNKLIEYRTKLYA